MSEGEAALVQRSQKGDRAAFEALVRSTARLLFAHLYLQVGDVHRTEDLVQETYLLAWRSIHQVSDPAGFRSWLLTLAHSALVDARRRESRKKRWGPRGDAEALIRLPAGGPQPEEAAQQNEERERVLELLRGLPEDYRQVLMLRYIGGADYQTIGRQLGLSNGSLRGLLSRGLALLRSQLTRTP